MPGGVSIRELSRREGQTLCSNMRYLLGVVSMGEGKGRQDCRNLLRYVTVNLYRPLPKPHAGSSISYICSVTYKVLRELHSRKLNQITCMLGTKFLFSRVVPLPIRRCVPRKELRSKQRRVLRGESGRYALQVVRVSQPEQV